jgi:hypothetical protein
MNLLSFVRVSNMFCEVTGRMKTLLSISSVCFAVACVAAGVVLIGTLHAKRELREANLKMKAELSDAQTKADTLLAEKQEIARQLGVFRELAESLQSRIADLETANAAEAEAAGKMPVVTPYQAQAYLGKSPLGWVWIIPQNLRKDTNTQRYVYEPVVWLDEGFRKQFVTHHTNVVEREVETRNYINTTYYPEPVYYLSSPVLPTHPIHRPPGITNRPPVSTLPPMPIQPLPQPFNPGSGKVTSQRLGTPAGAIKTRPVP